jgi:hypothetical protein
MNANTYNKINELISEYSKVIAELEQAEATIKTRQLQAAEALLPDHAGLKIRLEEVERQLHRLAAAHYDELFAENEKRNHKTPFGELTFRRASSIEFDDREKVLLKIKLESAREADAALREKRAPRFTENLFIRTHEEPNLEVLAGLDDSLLARFGFQRVQQDHFRVKPFGMKSDRPGSRVKAELEPSSKA